MRKRLVTLAIGALALPLLGGAAYAAAQGVSDKPAPQVVIPAARVADDGPNRGDDHPSNVFDDHGQDPTTTVTIDDHGQDPANHDQGDDHGQDPTTIVTVDDHGDDPANHDQGDDHSDDPTTTVAPTPGPTTPTTMDDHGDDPANHDQGDDGGHHGSDG